MAFYEQRRNEMACLWTQHKSLSRYKHNPGFQSPNSLPSFLLRLAFDCTWYDVDVMNTGCHRNAFCNQKDKEHV